MKQKLKFKHGVFWIKSTTPPIGWRWSKKRKLFYTERPEQAINYVKFAVDESTRSKLMPLVHRINQSRSSNAADSISIPSALPHLIYRPFQRAGVAFALDVLKRGKGCLIADEMGLGKTIEAIGIINCLKPKTTLIICPASVKINWFRELTMWCGVKANVIYGTYRWSDEPIVIINYDILNKFPEIKKRVWDLLIIDEAHYIKNEKAQRSKYVLSIKAKQKLALTGTPVTGRPRDLFNIIKFCDPTIFPNFFKFALRYCDAFKDEYAWNFDGASNLDELNNVLRARIMIRRKKRDVLRELPEKVHQIIELPKNGNIRVVTDEQKEIAHLKNLRPNLSAIDFQSIAEIRKKTTLAKLPSAIKFIKDVDSDKVVCFAWHLDVIKELAKHFKGSSVIVTGSTPPKKRQKLVDQFHDDPMIKLFIANIIAGGVGINLTVASHIIFLELDWVPANMMQAEDRCHRIGQRNSVLIQYLVFNGSIDAYIAQALVEKARVIKSTVDGKIISQVLKNY